MLITIVKIGTPSTVPTGKGRPYRKLEVLYRNEKGYTNTQNLVSFKNPGVFKVMEAAKEGEQFEVDVVKNESGFNEWKSVSPVGSTGAQQATPTEDTGLTTGVLPSVNKAGEATKSPIRIQVTEADRNRYIVRQSSLERAVEILAGSGVLTFENVTDLAARIEGWVFRPIEIETNNAKAAKDIVVSASSQASAITVTRKPGRPKKVETTDEPAEEPEVS